MSLERFGFAGYRSWGWGKEKESQGLEGGAFGVYLVWHVLFCSHLRLTIVGFRSHWSKRLWSQLYECSSPEARRSLL